MKKERPYTRTLIGQVDAFGEIQIGEQVFVCPDFARDKMIYVRITHDGDLIGEVIGYHNKLPFGMRLRKAA